LAQSIVEYVDTTLDNAAIGRMHSRVFAIVTAGLFFDVIDFIILGSLVPDMVRTHFASPAEIGTVGTAQIIGLFIGAVGQGEFTDRLGRKRIYQLSVLLYSLATIAAALAPNPLWLAFGRLIAGIGLGAASPTCFSYVAEYSPKRIRGRATAFMQFIGGACVWPLGTLFALGFRDTIGWRGIWIVIGLCGLVVFLVSFALPESPRWLVTHGQGRRALDLLERRGLGKPVSRDQFVIDQVANIRSDPIGVVFRRYRKRIIAAMICFFAFFGAALGLGGWLPNILADRGFTVTKSLTFTFGMQLSFPLSSLFMMYSLERFGRIRTAVTAFVLAVIMSITFFYSRVRHDGARCRLLDEFLHPARRQLDADFYLRGLPDQCPRFGVRPRAERRTHRGRRLVPADRVPEHLWARLRDDRDRRHDGDRRCRGDADRERNPGARARRNRAADRVN